MKTRKPDFPEAAWRSPETGLESHTAGWGLREPLRLEEPAAGEDGARSQPEAGGPLPGTERSGQTWAPSRGDCPNDFYNEDYERNSFGNLIEDRVYLSTWF